MRHDRIRSFLLLFSTNVITKICWALTLLLLLRTLGTQSFGFLATLWSSATIAAGLTDLGTGQVLLREASRDSNVARAMAIRATIIQLLLTLAITVILSMGAWWLLPIPGLSPPLRICVIVLSTLTPLVDWFQSLFTVYSQIGGSYTTYSRLRSARFITLLACLAITVFAHGALVAVSVVYFFITLIFAIWMARSTWKMLPAKENSTSYLSTRKLIAQGVPFLILTTLTLAYGRVEVSILGAFGYVSTAGAYHIIYQIVMLMYSVNGMFFTVIYPRLYSHQGDRAALASDFRDTVRWLSLLTWLVAPSLWLFASHVLVIIGGNSFVTYTSMLRVLDVFILFTPISAALNFLLPLDKLPMRVACDIIGVAATAAGVTTACTWSHPEYAPLAAVIGYALAMIAAHIALHGNLPGSNLALLKEYVSAGSRAIPAALAGWLMPGPWWLGAAVTTLLFALLLLVTRHPVVNKARYWLQSV